MPGTSNSARAKGRTRSRAVLTTAGLVAGAAAPFALMGLSPTPAEAAVCTGRLDCRSPYPPVTSCANIATVPTQTVNGGPNPVWVPGANVYVYLWYAPSPCRTIYADGNYTCVWNGTTLVARSFSQGNIYSDSHGLALARDCYPATSMMADDLGVVGLAMGWGNDNTWHKTGTY